MQARIDERKKRVAEKEWATLHWLLFVLAVEGLFVVIGIWALVLT